MPTTGDWAAPSVLLGVRDRALLLVGFVGALRRSELAGLDVAAVTDDPHGLVLRIGRSKTDATGAGAVVGIPHGHQPELARSARGARVVRAWRAALAVALGVEEAAMSGPQFDP